jgi:hypothetical protein
MSTNRPTRYPELAYAKHAANLWRIVAADTGAAIGPHYATKAELLADLARYAEDYGCAAAAPATPKPHNPLRLYRVTVVLEVEAENEDRAYQLAEQECSQSAFEYCCAVTLAE